MADANGEVFYEEIFTYDFLTFQKTLLLVLSIVVCRRQHAKCRTNSDMHNTCTYEIQVGPECTRH